MSVVHDQGPFSPLLSWGLGMHKFGQHRHGRHFKAHTLSLGVVAFVVLSSFYHSRDNCDCLLPMVHDQGPFSRLLCLSVECPNSSKNGLADIFNAHTLAVGVVPLTVPMTDPLVHDCRTV